MRKTLMQARAGQAPGSATPRLALAWLTSAGGLLLGSALVLGLASSHYARALLGLALLLAGWLHLVELAVQRALAPTPGTHPAPGPLLRYYCGFVGTQALGLVAGYAGWVQTGHLRHPGAVLEPATTLVAANLHFLLAHL